MSPPIFTPDGSEVSEIVLPDGSTASEVIGPDGNVVFEAGGDIPDSGLLHYYDAKEISATDGDSISQLDDQQGSENLTQLTSSKQPTYRTNRINGNPTLLSQSDYLDVNFASNISQPYEVFFVGRFNTVGGANYRGYDGFNNLVRLNANDATGEDSWTQYAGSIIRGGSLDTNIHLWTNVFNGSNSVQRLDGAQIAIGNSGSDSLDGLTLGNISGGGDGTDIDICWWGVYDPTATGYSRSDVESYLVNEWGPF